MYDEYLEYFKSYSNEITYSTHLCEGTQRRHFISAFSTYPEIVAELWFEIKKERGRDFNRYCRKKHLLWTLYRIKNNVIECNA